ncbi:MAG TPA: hypothetical protein VI462_11250 [Acidimicrobiia bacterium]
MANFVAKYCAPSPVVDIVVTSPTRGALRSTTYRGLLDVSVDWTNPHRGAGAVRPARQPRVLAGSGVFRRVAFLLRRTGRLHPDRGGRADGDRRRRRGVRGRPAQRRRVLVQLSVQLQTTNLLDSYTTRLAYEVTATLPHAS